MRLRPFTRRTSPRCKDSISIQRPGGPEAAERVLGRAVLRFILCPHRLQALLSHGRSAQGDCSWLSAHLHLALVRRTCHDQSCPSPTPPPPPQLRNSNPARPLDASHPADLASSSEFPRTPDTIPAVFDSRPRPPCKYSAGKRAYVKTGNIITNQDLALHASGLRQISDAAGPPRRFGDGLPVGVAPRGSGRWARLGDSRLTRQLHNLPVRTSVRPAEHEVLEP